MTLDFEVLPTGLIKNPTIVMLPDGPDHKNWIEVGEKEKRGLAIFIVAYTPQHGWLWQSGWITEEELEKARKTGKFQCLRICVGFHKTEECTITAEI